ncbi:MAG TPA: chemotaxis protein CheB [Anaerolineales bacterium]|nr:chemotaxis protein CheB [Anaerolineales bacterium]
MNKINLHAAQTDEVVVVGIGASAGGLQALQSFFEALPSDTGMVYVVIMHLHPEHESHLAELLQTRTHMPVLQVTSMVPAKKDHVYVIPPNRRLLMQDSLIDTAEFTEPRGQRAPIDYFFRSLAKGHPNAIGIILSGSGTDGAVGVKAIKEEGGLLMVQHPDEAEYDSMPLAAMATGLADIVLPVKGLAEKLVEYTRFSRPLPLDADKLPEAQLELMRRIIAHVHVRTGHDFSKYKRSTLLRRIQRRMQIYSVSTLEAYLDHLRQNAAEATALFNDILIGVTSFFRDHEAWEQLATQVIPQLIRERGPMESIRVWTIGCSTGEEAYGLAILLFEAFDRLELPPRIQVFASDLDEISIKYAREGVYPTAIEADVSPERLERFFTLEGNHYRVRREVRDAVLFTHHSVLRDAPFSRLDLIACRNLLIYLERDVQSTVFDIFHYSLNPGGYLFLGNSESVESAHELFEIVDKAHRIYRSKPWNREQPHIPSLPLSVGMPTYPELYNQPHIPRLHSTMELPRLADEHARAVEAHAPPSVLVNDKYAVLHVSETAGRYLVQPSGPITTDVLKLVRPELQLELRTALLRAFEKDQASLTPPLRVQFNGHPHRVVLSIQPRNKVTEPVKTSEKQALVFFLEDEQEEPTIPAVQEQDATVQSALVRQLENEVRLLREQLQASIEESESSSEELKASNEELQSINEEFRSATEELETSKEELQSVNEELQTVNNELKNQLDEVSRSHSDLENLMSSTEIAMLFLDRELRIRHYTPGMQELFNIMPGDRGRPIKHLAHTLRYDQFLGDAANVLRTLVPIEREVQDDADEWFLLRMRPYRTTDDRIDGVIFTFVKITRLKQAEQQLVELNATLEQRVLDRTQELDEANQKIAQARDVFFELFDANPIPTALTRAEDDVLIHVNVEFLNYFGFERDKIIGRNAQELGLGLGLALEQNSMSEPLTRETLLSRIKRQRRIGNYEMQVTHPSGEVRNLLATVQYTNLENSDGFITVFTDITGRVRAEQKIRTLAAELTGAEQSERHRLSQILHDDLQQRIFAVQMQLSFLRDAYEKNDLQAFAVDFPQIEEWLADAIRVTRQLSVDLSPPILHGEGLVEAIIWLASQMEEQYGLRVQIKSNGTPIELDEKKRVLVFYAIRELLFNTVKHAGTLEAAVRFEHYDSHLLVIVRDQGTGFDSATTMNDPQMAHGLLIIRHRLDLLGCNMEVNSHPGNGTEVIIDVPYK